MVSKTADMLDPELKPPTWLRDDPPNLGTSDAFRVGRLVVGLAELVHAAPAPFTIALSGSWGVGKTTLSTAIIEELSHAEVPCSLVDLWSEDVEHLRRTLVIEVGAALRVGVPNIESRKAVAQRLDEAHRVTRTIVNPPQVRLVPSKLWESIRQEPINAAMSVAVLALAFILAESFAKPVVPALSTLTGALLSYLVLSSGLLVRVTASTETQAPAEGTVAVREVFTEIVTDQGSGKGPVVVLIDNLDRLSAGEALVALREIRSFVDVPKSKCVFLIPVDRRAFVEQLQEALGGMDAARDYLDKFFNVDISLTEPEPLDLRNWIRDLATSLFPLIEGVALPELVQVVARGSHGSPRAAKRILNGTLTRNRLLAPEVRTLVRLQQVAFVESVTLRFPWLLSRIVSSPRRFVEIRATLAERLDQPNNMPLIQTLGPFTDDTDHELLEFLSANNDVQLSESQLRLLLSLRADQFWTGAADPERLVPALQAGQPGPVDDLFKDLSPDAANTTLSRILAWIELSIGQGYLGDAANAVNASSKVATGRDDFLRLAHQLFRRLGAARALRMLSTDALGQILGGQLGAGTTGALATAVVEALDGIGDDPPLKSGAIAAIRAAGAALSVEGRRNAQRLVAPWDDDTVEPLFQDPVDPLLVAAEIGTRYAKTLADSTLGPATAAVDRAAARRLRVSFDAGWRVQASAEAIATKLNAALPPLGTLTADQQALLEDLIQILSQFRGPLFDQLAVTLANWGGKPRTLALRLLPLLQWSDKTTPQVRAALDPWMTSASYDDVSEVLTVSAEPLRKRGIDYESVLVQRWLAGQSSDYFASLALKLSRDSAVGAIKKGLQGVPAATALPRHAAIPDLGTDPELANALASAAAVHIQKMTSAELTSLREHVVTISGATPETKEIDAAVQARLRQASVPELPAATDFARTISPNRKDLARSLADVLAERVVALGAAPLTSFEWIVASASTLHEAALAGVLAAQVRAGSYPPADVLDTLPRLRVPLKGRSAIRHALAMAASVASVNCETAGNLLDEAASWRECRGDELVEFTGFLDAIGARCAEASEQIARLRAPAE